MRSVKENCFINLREIEDLFENKEDEAYLYSDFNSYL